MCHHCSTETSPDSAEGGKTPAPEDGSKVPDESAATDGETQEGEEGGEDGKQKEEEENKIPDSFYYDYEEHVSKAKIKEESGLPEDMISL